MTRNARAFSMTMLVVATLVVAGCATHRPAPVEDRTLGREAPRGAPPSQSPVATPEPPPPATYTVKRGDTLHQIALDNGLDYRELAAWNNLENVNKIYPGQVLRLSAPGSEPSRTAVAAASPVAPHDATSGVVTAPLRTPAAIGESRSPPSGPAATTAPPASVAAAEGTLKTSPKAVKMPYSEQAVRELELAASSGPAPRNAPAPSTASVATANPAPATSNASPSAPSASPSGKAASPAPPASGATAGDDQLEWAWPAKGKIVSGFSETASSRSAR